VRQRRYVTQQDIYFVSFQVRWLLTPSQTGASASGPHTGWNMLTVLSVWILEKSYRKITPYNCGLYWQYPLKRRFFICEVLTANVNGCLLGYYTVLCGTQRCSEEFTASMIRVISVRLLPPSSATSSFETSVSMSQTTSRYCPDDRCLLLGNTTYPVQRNMCDFTRSYLTETAFSLIYVHNGPRHSTRFEGCGNYLGCNYIVSQ
jgi:hypothetical protein